MTEERHPAMLPDETESEALCRLASFSNVARPGDGYRAGQGANHQVQPAPRWYRNKWARRALWAAWYGFCVWLGWRLGDWFPFP